MTIQAQYPCDLVLLNRSERERKEMDFPHAAPGFLDPSALLFANGAAPNLRERGREATGVPVVAPSPQQNLPVNLFSLQPQPCSTPLAPPALVSLAQLQYPPAVVSTGLRLSFEEGHQQQNQKQSNLLLSSSSSSSLLSSILSEELAAHINQQKDEIEQFLHAQEEQLRRTLAQRRRRRHYRYLLDAAKELAGRRLREKEAELERVVRRSAELEDRLARLRTESMAWQAKAMADQATAASLQAQLQQVAAAATAAASVEKGSGESPPADDAESVFVDPDRVESERSCRGCRGRLASVVLLPCRHLCLCDACDGQGGPAESSCPVCHCVRTGSVRVFLA